MDKKEFKAFCERYMGGKVSEALWTEYLAHIYFLLNGATVVQQFDFMEMEVGIGFREVH